MDSIASFDEMIPSSNVQWIDIEGGENDMHLDHHHHHHIATTEAAAVRTECGGGGGGGDGIDPKDSDYMSSSSPTTQSAWNFDTLYNSLSYNVPEMDLSDDQKNELVLMVRTLTQEQKDIIYYLCLIDFSKFYPNKKVVFPYKCKQIGPKTLEIKIDSLPIRTKQILYKFVKLTAQSS
jgi:hypothetical protein